MKGNNICVKCGKPFTGRCPYCSKKITTKEKENNLGENSR
jgi:DNA-directed RNA polymerase subunit RPC12/RpoP